MAKKNATVEAPKKESKKFLVVSLWKEYLSKLSSSEVSAIAEKGDEAGLAGFIKFLNSR